MDQIKARIRAEVFNALDDQTESRPPLSNENMLINELIREYLEFNQYKYSASVLQAESGQPQASLDRAFLAQELNIMEDRDTASVPLLYAIMSHFLRRRSRSQSPGRRPSSPGRRPPSPDRGPQSPGRRPRSPGRKPQSPGRRPYNQSQS